MLRLVGLQPCYEPNQPLEFEYRLSKLSAEKIDKLTAIESSVLWTTEGKGTDDLGVHFFQRITGISLIGQDWTVPRRLRSMLPSSPLSYEGTLLKIRWSVRVRAFLNDGTDIVAEQPFYLGALTREI